MVERTDRVFSVAFLCFDRRLDVLLPSELSGVFFTSIAGFVRELAKKATRVKQGILGSRPIESAR